ncbi:MAG TPA: ribosome-associated translation inhibitor RaiA [Candidatus Paceibacterota bacterium]
MKINLKTKNFSLTPSIKNYLEQKLNSLDKFLPGDESIFADVELSKTTKHHQKGDVFMAEVNLKIPGRLIRAVAEQWDLRIAIDAAKDELQREIKSNKEKNISLHKRGARMLKKLLKGE